MLIHQDWLVENSHRKYPVDDSATATSDSGELLPEDFLIDANLWVPRHVYSLSPLRELRYVYVSSAAVSSSLVSLTFLGSHLPAISPDGSTPAAELFVPLAVIVVRKPVIPYKNYPVTPLLDGVKGWVTFGTATQRNGIGLMFSNPKQSLLVPKAVRFFNPLPVESLSVEGGFSSVQGDVTLVGNAPFLTEVRDVLIDGDSKRAIVLSLEETADVLKKFSGPCGKLPESGTCDKAPILSVSGVTPDCDGNLTIEFQDITVRWLDDGSGFCLDSAINLEDVCGEEKGLPNDEGVLPSEYDYVRSCNLPTPYTLVIGGSVLRDEFIPQSGFWYITGGKIYGLPQSGGAFAGTCHASIPSGITSRRFQATLAVSGSAEGGMFIMAQGLRKILIKSDGTVWKTALGGTPVMIGSGAIMDVTISDGQIDSGSFSYTFAPGDEYNQPQGVCGVFVGGDPYMVTGVVELSAFQVSDT